MANKTVVVRDLDDMVTYTNINFETVFHKFKEQNKTNTRLTFIAMLSATCIYLMSKRIKKQEETINDIRKELDEMKQSEEE